MEVSNDCVEGYQSIFSALETELLELEHFVSEPNFSDVFDAVQSSDTFGLHTCLDVTNGDAPASNFLEEDKIKNELLAGTWEQTADVLDCFQDICEDYLLDIANDETSMPHKEKVNASHKCDEEKEKASKSTGEVNPLARIFRFKTKPRARNVKRRKPATYSDWKSFSEVGNLVFNLSDMGDGNSNLIVSKKRWCKPKRYKNESLEYNLRNRMQNCRSFAAAEYNELQDDDDAKTQKGNIGRKKRHTSWSVAEVLRLVEGVSQHGVGKWTEIKRLFFSACPQRSSVDLKDKWRNLLRASYKSTCLKGTDVGGNASPTIPQNILCRVRELSMTHPYPRKQQLKTEAA